MNITQLFPYPLGRSKLKRSFTQKEKDFFNSTLVVNSGTNKKSNDNYILNNPELKDIHDFIMSELDDYLKNTNPVSKDGPFPYITQSWLNFCGPGESHHLHRHFNSLISGVLYIQANIKNDSIFFARPIEKTPVIDYNVGIDTDYNSIFKYVPVDVGTLIFFPSTLGHGVAPTIGNYTRVSLAFNVFFKGTLTTADKLTELKL